MILTGSLFWILQLILSYWSNWPSRVSRGRQPPGSGFQGSCSRAIQREGGCILSKPKVYEKELDFYLIRDLTDPDALTAATEIIDGVIQIASVSDHSQRNRSLSSQTFRILILLNSL